MRVVLAVMALVLVSCGPSEQFEIRQFHLRSEEVTDGNEYIRAEMNKRLYGAVTEEERRERLGHFYSVSWERLSGVHPVKVVFEYRQQATGSTVKRITKEAPASVSGKLDIEVAGADYRKNGRVLAWRMTLYDGATVIGQKKSFLWD